MKSLKVFCIGFSKNPDFAKSNNYLLKFLRNGDNIMCNVCDNTTIAIGEGVIERLDMANVIIIGDFLEMVELEMLKKVNLTNKRIIMFIGEPRNKMLITKHSDIILNSGYFNIVYGCINETTRSFKLPLYMTVTIEDLKKINTMVKTINVREGKRQMALINRHDMGGTRSKIYMEMIERGIEIDCPGKFMNNCSNEELNRIGNSEWLKGYMFNICFENFVDAQEGYITEKLMNACLSGTIPIYNGKLDKIDKLIFNKDRILMYNEEGFYEKFDKLIKSEEEYEKFYRQDVFMETADIGMGYMEMSVLNMFDGCRDII